MTQTTLPSPASPPAPTAAASKRTRLPLLIAGAAALLVAALAGIPYLPGVHGTKTEEAAPPAEAAGLVAMDPLLVNLADREATRFAKVTVRLVVPTKEGAAGIAEDPLRQARLRSAILELLAQETAAGLATADGRNRLRQAVAVQATQALGQQVQDVLFTDLVVQ